MQRATSTWLFVDATSYFGGHETMLLRWLDELERKPELLAPRLLAREGGRLWDLAPLSVRGTPFAPRSSRHGWAGLRDLWRQGQSLRRAVRTLKPECVIVASGALHFHFSQVPLLSTFASMGYRYGRLKDEFVRWFYAKVPSGWIAITQAQAQAARTCFEAQASGHAFPGHVRALVHQLRGHFAFEADMPTRVDGRGL